MVPAVSWLNVNLDAAISLSLPVESRRDRAAKKVEYIVSARAVPPTRIAFKKFIGRDYKNMRRIQVKPPLPTSYIIRYVVFDGIKHEKQHKNLGEILKTKRYLMKQGVTDLDVSVILPSKPSGSEMFPVNY